MDQEITLEVHYANKRPIYNALASVKLRLLSAAYHYQNNIIEQAATNFFWRLLIHFGQSLGYHPSKPQGADKLSRGLSISGHHFLFHKHKLQTVCCFRQAMTRKFGWSKLRSDRIFH